jgi:BetI-type transcriptional repressor, C-terminal
VQATVRIPQLIAALPEPRSTDVVLRALLIDLLGLDGESREGARLGAAMLARAAIDPQAAATARAAYDGVTGFLAARLRVPQTNGVRPAHLDADHAARHRYAVAEGLRWPALVGGYTPTRPWPSLTSTSRYCSVSPGI